MITEEKQLLLKDLCARLPYGVICHIENDSDFEDILQPYDGKVSFGLLDRFRGHHFDLKPYLRSMSSMTGKEETAWHELTFGQRWITFDNVERCADWLNSHHIDYRGLIEKGLALEAPKNLYKKTNIRTNMARFNNEPEWVKVENELDLLNFSDWYAFIFLHDAQLLPYKDGNSWCILVGEDLQSGIAGFGNSLNEALSDFLKNVKEQR